MNKSESIKELAAALSKAQGDMPPLAKDSTGQVGQQKTRYASLDAVIAVISPVLADNGIAVVQFPISAPGNRVGVETVVTHTSGEWMSQEFTLPAQETSQGFGSGLSYARRYALLAIARIAPEDDDGAAAMPAARTRAAATPKERAPLSTGYVGADQETGEIPETKVAQKVWASFWLKVKELQFTEEYVHEVAGAPSLSKFTRAELEDLLAKLKDKRAAGGPPKPLDIWRDLPPTTPEDMSPTAAAHRQTAGAR